MEGGETFVIISVSSTSTTINTTVLASSGKQFMVEEPNPSMNNSLSHDAPGQGFNILQDGNKEFGATIETYMQRIKVQIIT